MRKKILAFVFAAALLVAMAVPLFGGGGTAEAAIHPKVSSACAVNGTPGDAQSPPGQTDNPAAVRKGLMHPWQAAPTANTFNGNSGENNDHCQNE